MKKAFMFNFTNKKDRFCYQNYFFTNFLLTTVYMLLNLDEKTIVISKFFNSVLAAYSHLNRLMTIYNVNILHANSF